MVKTAKGDKSAFRLLAAELNGLLFAEGHRLLRGHADLVEDAAQEALINLWRSAPRWNDTGDDNAVTAYARTVMRHAAIDILRTRQRRAEEQMPEDGIELEETATTPMAETVHELKQGLDMMTPKQRHAAMMFYGAGYEQKEIANDMGVSEKAIERMLAYARKRLKDFRERNET